jgi:hypothetical protein
MSENVRRAPGNALEQIAMRALETDQVVTAIMAWAEYDSISCFSQQ